MKRIAGIVLVIILIPVAYEGFQRATLYCRNGPPVPAKPQAKILWTYEAPQRGGFVAAPWVEVRLRRLVEGRTELVLASRGREHAFGGFLTDDERRDLAGVLRGALLEARGGPRI